MIGSAIGNIRVLDVLGEGGMGRVYVGRDEKLQRLVALKTIRHERVLDTQIKARFLQEARILSRLRHPGICQIYDYVEGAESDVLVLELVDGRDLSRVLEGGLDAATALRIGIELLEVLVAAHAEGIVHRDLKPANVILERSGRVKVLDFGLARSLAPASAPRFDSGPPSPAPAAALATTTAPDPAARSSEAPTPAPPGPSPYETVVVRPEEGTPGDPWVSVLAKTRAGVVLGTPQYMSPEQARGDPATPASDMYSFGLLLQHLLSGKPPYPRGLDLTTLIARAKRAETEPFQGSDTDLADLIGRLKSLEPADRPTALEAAQRLRWIRDRPARRLRRLAAAAAAALVLSGGVKYTLDLRSERAAAVDARSQAEGLVGFMLDDLYESLRPVGRVELLDKVAHKALEHYGGDTRESLERDGGRGALALARIGAVLEERADWGGALTAHGRALAAFEDLLARAPSDAVARRRVAQAHLAMGRALWYLGRFADAQAAFERALDVAERLDAKDGERRLLLVNVHGERANARWRNADLEGALEDATAALRLAEGPPPQGRAAAGWPAAVAFAYAQQCHVYRELGRLEQELAACSAAVARREEVADRDPTDAMARADLAKQLGWLANAYKRSGDVPRALVVQRRALRLTEQLAARDPDNKDWLNNLAMWHVRLGELLQLDGQPEEARASLQTAVRLMEPLTRGEASVYMLDTQALALLMLGDAQRARPLVQTLLDRGWKKKEFLFWAEKRGLLPHGPG